MNKFWTGLRATECEECGVLLEWHDSLRTRLKIGGISFRVGAIIFGISFIDSFVNFTGIAQYTLIVGFIMLLFGLLITRTKYENIKVQQKT
ncbi:hypothetical protein NBRC116495_38940 [Aurantivibrio plasticivorans]